MSTAAETIAFLANYNSWRRGDETLEMPSPAEIGATIDNAADLLRKYDDLKARAERAEADVERLSEWQAGVIANERLHHAERKDAIARAESAEREVERLRDIGCVETLLRAERAESELAGIRALADRRNKRDHSADTTHQLVAALDQALEIAQAELAATKSTLDEEVNCAEKAEHEVVRQYARAERAEAELKAYRDAVDAQPWASDLPIRVLLDQITSELLTTRNLLMSDADAQAELAAEREKVKTLRCATDLLMVRANDELKSGRPALIAMQWHRIEPIIAALAATEDAKP